MREWKSHRGLLFNNSLNCLMVADLSFASYRRTVGQREVLGSFSVDSSRVKNWEADNLSERISGNSVHPSIRA